MKRAVSPDRERRWNYQMSRTTGKDSAVDLTGGSEEKMARNERYPPRAELTCFMKGVTDHDVLLSGPGGSLDPLNRHVGNVRFEEICLRNKVGYLCASSVLEQRVVAQNIVSEVRRLGRFLTVSRCRAANSVWTGKEVNGRDHIDKVLESVQIILGMTNKKRKRSVSFQAGSTTSTTEPPSRASVAVSPQCTSASSDETPSQSALEKLASVAQATRSTMKPPPRVPVLSTKPLPTISFDPNLLPVRYSNVNLSSLSDDFRHQIGLRDYVSDYYGGDYTRMATEHARLTACPHPDTWEVRLVEAAGRAFDICQQYISPNMKLSGNQQLHTRTVVHNDGDARATKRTRLEGGAVERFRSEETESSATEILCAGTITDCKRTASRYVLYIARQLYRSKSQSGIAKWFVHEVLNVLEQGKPEAQEVAVLLLVLAAMEVNQDEKKFDGVEAWSFAGTFVVGSSVKLVPLHNQWRTRQRTPSYIRRITGRLLHFHEIIFAGATVNCTRSREFARWRPILQAPGRLGKSFVMQDLSMKFRIARHFEKACDMPPPAGAPRAAAAPPAPPGATGVPITPDRKGNGRPWVDEEARGY